MRRLFIICLFAVSFTGCFGWKKFSREHNSLSVPEDIRDVKYVLLVQKLQGVWYNYQNYLVNKQMRKFYQGRYEMVSATDIDTNPKYADVNVYRYVIRRTDDPTFVVKSDPQSYGWTYYDQWKNHPLETETVFSQTKYRSRMVPFKDFADEIIYDRKTKAHLKPTGVETHTYAQGIKLFSKAVSRKY
jgi:hypothetical protein